MLVLLAAFQLASATPHALSPKDSAKLEARVRDAEFRYIMDWRHEWVTWRTDLYWVDQSLARDVARLPAPPTVLYPAGSINSDEVIRYDIDQHEAMAHFIR